MVSELSLFSFWAKNRIPNSYYHIISEKGLETHIWAAQFSGASRPKILLPYPPPSGRNPAALTPPWRKNGKWIGSRKVVGKTLHGRCLWEISWYLVLDPYHLNTCAPQILEVPIFSIWFILYLFYLSKNTPPLYSLGQ